MIRIPHREVPAFTFEDYDVLLTVYGNRKKLKKGKKAKYTIKSLKSMFWWCLYILLCVVIIYILSDKPLHGMDAVMVYGCSVIGVVFGIVTIAYPKWLEKMYLKAKENGLKADFVFDEEGVHVWENPEKGFDRTWDQFTDCFISSHYIFVFFTELDYTLIMSNEEDEETKLLAALEMGNRMDIVTRFEAERKKVKGITDYPAH